MAGPCLSDGNCTDFYMNDNNLQVDVLISDSPGNCITCDNVAPHRGLYVPCHRSRFVEGISSTRTGAYPSVTNAFGGVRIAVEAFGADVGNNAGPIELTNTVTTPYTNNTGLTELVEFEYILGVTDFNLRAGWDFTVGLKMSWSGLASITPQTALRYGVGFNTGVSAIGTGANGKAIPGDGATYLEPAGVTHGTFRFQQNAEIAPGETLTLQHRMYAQFQSQGLPDAGGTDQSIFTSFGSAAHIRTWTKG